MAYSENEAKLLVIRAGKMLVESGLIARTWGNISARISDKQFAITPSGLAYETLTPEQIVIVNILDCSYDGNRKPSSEKGVHADAYRLRPDVNFVIHTHQLKASVISIEGKDFEVMEDTYKNILGDRIPCAAYGISSTKKLRKNIATAIYDYPYSKAILMKHHGTLCMGQNIDNTFEIAQTLEVLAKEEYDKVCGAFNKNQHSTLDYGNSHRKGDTFSINFDGDTKDYKLDNIPKTASEAVLLHEAIYKISKVNHILHMTDAVVVEVSKAEGVLKPYLDDLAQIAGVNIKKVTDGFLHRKSIAGNLKHKNAVFIKNEGALCTGITESDAIAVGMILKKGCEADLYALSLKTVKGLGLLDALLQRFVYVKKYSKIKNK
jgi:L-ribulose-5-phosphate 4-epimerase